MCLKAAGAEGPGGPLGLPDPIWVRRGNGGLKGPKGPKGLSDGSEDVGAQRLGLWGLWALGLWAPDPDAE